MDIFLRIRNLKTAAEKKTRIKNFKIDKELIQQKKKKKEGRRIKK